jgi:hypothetical protein
LTKSYRIWLALVVTVIDRIHVPIPDNGLREILQRYTGPSDAYPAAPTWVQGFSNGVIPVPCHSHNDYRHRIPLYEGLAAGCISTEADIWVGNTTDGHLDLFVGHDRRSLSPSRTLSTLYLQPLSDILTNQNSVSPVRANLPADTARVVLPRATGVFSMAPNVSLVLLLDFKTPGIETWNTVVQQLDILRDRGWLTFWTPTEGVVERPLTIVISGAAPFDAIISNTTYRDIFYDAPLTQLSEVNNPFTLNNSFYASTSLPAAIGSLAFPVIRAGQKARLASQVEKATAVGLRSRYWDTPSWPVGWRNRVWSSLIEEGVSVLNIDDLWAGARWDWQMCVVGSINICNT